MDRLSITAVFKGQQCSHFIRNSFKIVHMGITLSRKRIYPKQGICQLSLSRVIKIFVVKLDRHNILVIQNIVSFMGHFFVIKIVS